ncbi:hypothetical protein [Cryobacterium sp. MP_3.1]|uniref:hypothetical protein n=1 Tax=Cryobacterium sp. MP_3.1 TaxID=3071711 RepID=UPI002E0D95F2
MSLVVSGSDIAPSARRAIGEADGVIDTATQRTGATAGRNLSTGIGLGLAAAGAGITVWAKQQVDSLARIESIGAQTDSALKATGAGAWTTRAKIDELAGSLENKTATEAESITMGANMLLTFKNVKNAAGEGNDVFDQSIGIMTDVSRAMGTDVAGGAIQLGKALNDPVAGISALSRVGVTFTEDQKAMIASLVDSGDVMGAQKVILAELNSEFGGAGAAYAETYAGKVDLVGHAWGTLGETVLTAAMPLLLDLAGVLNTVFTYLNENAWALNLVAAVVGTGLVIAFGLWAASIWATTTALLASPATWVILGIVAAVVGLVAWLSFATDGFSDWGSLGAQAVNVLTGGVNGLIHAINGAARGLEWLFSLGGALGNWSWGEIPIIELQKIKGLATGGHVTSSGATLVGENGPEILQLGRGSSVVPLQDGYAAGSGSSTSTTNNFYNPVAERASDSLRSTRNTRAAGVGV